MGFGNLKNVKKATPDLRASYELEDLDGEPTLTVAPATEVNPEFYNRMLKQASKGKGAGTKAPTVDVIEAARGRDRMLYAKYIVKGWEGIIDDDGAQVSFSREACLEFLTLLPNHMFDEIRNFCMDITNFLDDPQEAIDEETILGNSSSD